MDRTEGGRDDRVVSLSRARRAPVPADVARIASHLANLLDDTLALRGTGVGVRDFAGSFLGVAPTELVAGSAALVGVRFHLAALALAEDLERHPPVATIGEDTEEPPRWERLDLGDSQPRVPVALAAACAADTLAPVPLVIAVERNWRDGGFHLVVYSRREDAPAGRAYLDDLTTRSHTGANPYRGRILEAGETNGMGLTFSVLTPQASTRDDIVLPDDVWAAIDLNVHGLYAAAERLGAAGLVPNRGVLLEGPPGTGKTAVCRALAQELVGPVTVVFCDARTVARWVRDLYRQLEDLAPAMVVMEDVDLVIADRGHGGGGEALNDFLLALDGAMSRHSAVVTVATTNDVDGIDPAARRASRFDCVVRVDKPDEDARGRILGQLLAGFDPATVDVDVDRVAAGTRGATGADLRELVALAVLHGEPVLRTELLLRLARPEPDEPTGLYL
jgi:hypothetical protein